MRVCTHLFSILICASQEFRGTVAKIQVPIDQGPLRPNKVHSEVGIRKSLRFDNVLLNRVQSQG